MKRNGTRRLLAGLLALVMVLVLLPVGAAKADGEIEISTYEQLKEFAARVNARETGLNAKLTADITCTDKTWTPIGDDHFRYGGTFDGQGYKIIGLSNADVDYSGLSADDEVYIGLFGRSYGTVKNVVIEDCDLSFASSDADGYVYMGAVAGYNGGTVEACSVSGKLSAALTSYSVTARVGGVVGDNHNTVKICTNSGAVSVSGNYSSICVGGVVGNDDSSVQNCANTGAVSGAGYDTVGGIAGSGVSVKNCFNTGAISGENGSTGGIVGYTAYGTVENCLNVGTVTGDSLAGGVIGQNSYGTVKTCLSVGAVSGSGRYNGGVVGICPDNASVKSYVENCYCLDTSASAAIGNAGSAVVTSVSALTAEQLKSISNCVGFSTDTWYEGLSYPVLKNLSGEVHLYANSNEDLVLQRFICAYAPTKIANPFTYADHDFTGWNTDPDGNGDPYSEDDTFTLQPGEALTLHAQWKEADPVEIGTWADLDAALKAGGKYTLTADVAPENPYWADALTVPSGVTVMLDLNGHIVDRGYTEQGWDGSILIVSGNLTLLDSDPTATHDPAVTYTDPVTGREITVNGGILKGGWPDQYGGGVQVQGGAVRMEGGSIACNSVGKNGFGAVAALGGGVYIQSGTFLMSGGAIVGNKAVNKNTMMPDNPLGRGGAVYIANGVFTLTGGLIRGNTAGEAAGGIYMGDHGAFVMTGGTIVGNTAPGMNNFVDYNDNFSIDLAWITLNSNDGNEYVSEQTFTLNDTAPIATDIFVRDGYEFTGWNTKADGSGTPYADGADFYAGTENIGLALYAQWRQIVFPITFVNEDGTKLQSGPVAVGETPVYEGETPTKPATAQYTYTFAGWKDENGIVYGLTDDLPAANGDMTYTAVYTSTVNEYTITFVNEDGTELQSGKVAYGKTPEYNGETPTKEKTLRFEYTFAGWDPEIVPVTGDATYTAVFTESLLHPILICSDVDAMDVVVKEGDETLYRYDVTVTDLLDGAVEINSAQIFLTYDHDKLELKRGEGPVDWTINDAGELLSAAWASDSGVPLKNGDVVLTLYFAAKNVAPGETVAIGLTGNEVSGGSALAFEVDGEMTEFFAKTQDGSITFAMPDAVTIAGADVLSGDIYAIENGKILYRYDLRMKDLPEAGLWINSAQIFVEFDHAILALARTEGAFDWTVTENGDKLMAVWASDEDVQINEDDVVLTLWFEKIGEAQEDGRVPIVFTTNLLGNTSAVSIAFFGTVTELETNTVDGSIKFEEVVYGDANCDGVVTSADAALILRAIVGLSELSMRGALNADVDGDMEVTAADAALILRYVVGLVGSFPA